MAINKNQWLAIFNFLALILVLVMNGLANALPINNKTTGELSAQYPNLFVPAGYTFSIWGIIYLLLFVFTIYQLVHAFSKTKKNHFIRSIGPWFIISSLANSFWILVWHYEMVFLSLLLMLILFVSLLKIYLNLNIGHSGCTKKEKWAVHIPFSVYLGWITVATIANTTAFLVEIDWKGWGISEILWTVVMILISAVITLVMIFKRNDIYFAIVLLWAYGGILWKRIHDETVNDFLVEIILILVLIFIFITSLIRIIQKRNY